MKRNPVRFLTLLALLSLVSACAHNQPPKSEPASSSSPAPADNYPNLAAQAKEITDAFARKDYGRFADLTYAKVIEMAGGREKMLAVLTQQLKEMEAEGVVILSSTAGTPTQFVHDAGSIYAVLPEILKVKAKDGTFQAEGTLVGVSSDGGTNWTFIDAGGKDKSELKTLLPGVADRLKLPEEKRPVKISN